MWYKLAKNKKYYHASPKHFKPGDYLTPNLPEYKSNFQFSQSEYIYLTESPVPHYTIVDKANAENWNVYEVLPTNPKRVWIGKCWDEWFTDRPCVVQKLVGSARGLSKAGKPSKKPGNSQEQWHREKLQKAKEALNDETLRKEFEEFWNKTPEAMIKEMEALIKYKNPDTSKALYKFYPYRGKPK